MGLINLLILLGIIYLIFLIIDKFGLYILAILLGLLIASLIPLMISWIKIVFTWLMNLVTTPIYWMTGIRIEIAWWIGLIIFLVSLIPLLSLIPTTAEARCLL